MSNDFPQRDSIISEKQLDDHVLNLIQTAAGRGLIPICGIVSQEVSPGQHRVIGFGGNQLRRGTPGIHGETAAVMNAGIQAGGFSGLTVTTSLTPCKFCRRTMGDHLGVSRVRVLDKINYNSGADGSEAIHGFSLDFRSHAGIEEFFGQWVGRDDNKLIWARDIGEFDAPTPHPVVWDNLAPERQADILSVLREEADAASSRGQAPIGALILDRFGEIIGVSHGRIFSENDPTLVPAMAAWRHCGARTHWNDKTLVLSSGIDAITLAMFEVFHFGQLVLASMPTFDPLAMERIAAVSTFSFNHDSPTGRRDVQVTKLSSHCDNRLRDWAFQAPEQTVRAYFGHRFAR